MMTMRTGVLGVVLLAMASTVRAEEATVLQEAATPVLVTNAAAINFTEWDGLRHVTAADPKQLRALLEQSEGWLPWDPVLFLDAPTVIWTDFSRLPQELAGLPKQWGQDRYGVKFRGLQVRVNLDPPVEELWGQWAFTWEWLPDQAAAKRYADLICRQFGLKALTPAAYERLLREPRNWWLQPRLLTLSVWVADLAEQEAYAQNIAAEIAAWEAEEKLGRSGVPAATGMVALDGGGQRMSLLLLGGGCPITNEAAPFGLTVAGETNGAMTVTWESCSSHLYQVRTTEELSFTNVWTARALLIGGDGTSSWTDTNAPAFSHRFYRVHRYAFSADADEDGLSNYAEFLAGTDPANPDTDGDGALDGDDPAPLDPQVGGARSLAVYNAFAVYTNGMTKVYVQADIRSTNALVTVSCAEFFHTFIGTNGAGEAMFAADGQFDSTNEVARLAFTPSFPPGERHVLWLHAQDNTGQWSPSAKVIVNPNIHDILNKIEANYSAIQDLQYEVVTGRMFNGVTIETNTATVFMKGPYRIRSQAGNGIVNIRNQNRYYWHHSATGAGSTFEAGARGNFAPENNCNADYFWQVPRTKVEIEATKINSTGSIFDLVMVPKPGRVGFTDLTTVDYSKGFVTRLETPMNGGTVVSEYLQPIEIMPGRWLFSVHRQTLRFENGDEFVTQFSATNVQANQGLPDSLFAIPTP